MIAFLKVGEVLLCVRANLVFRNIKKRQNILMYWSLEQQQTNKL